MSWTERAILQAILDGDRAFGGMATAALRLDALERGMRVKVRNEFQRGQAVIILEIANQYPTEDAYISACRANHWHVDQLRAHGIEPLRIPVDAPHYPPEDFNWKEAEKND